MNSFLVKSLTYTLLFSATNVGHFSSSSQRFHHHGQLYSLTNQSFVCLLKVDVLLFRTPQNVVQKLSDTYWYFYTPFLEVSQM